MAQKLFAQDQLSFTRYAAEALTAYRFVKPNASASEKVDMCDTQGERAIGVTDSAWSADDEACKIIYGGIAYVEAGGTVAVGDYVTGDASGKAIKAAGTVAPDFIHGTAESAGSSGARISVRLHIGGGASISSTGAASKLLIVPITRVAATTEQDTGYDLPAKCFVRNVFLDVTTAEATGATKTVDVGTDGSGSNDPDGFLDGLSVAATGVIVPTLASAGQTVGALLRADEDGSGALVPEPDGTSGGESITYTLGSNDFAELVANIVIDYIEVK